MKKIIFHIYHFVSFLGRVVYKIVINPLKVYMLKSSGKNVRIGKGSSMTYQNVSVGNSVYIGPNATFICTRAEIKVGDHVMFGPNVFVITGGHRTDIKGRFMDEIQNEEKKPEDDKDIFFEGDNWIGANSVILKGVTIGKGSVVAAGSVVTKNVKPYTIVGGVPASFIKGRFEDGK